MMQKYLWPAIFILLSQAAGLIGSIFTGPAIPGWYAGLNKPGFNPPGWLFGPVWLILYTMMGLASYFVWQKWNSGSLSRVALIIFFVHLALNALWSFLFFGLKNPQLAFFEIILLWVSILALIILFWAIDRRAAYLMIPYILWVSFAAVLNFSIWRLNL